MENLVSVQKLVFSCPSCQKAYEADVNHIQSSTPVFFCQQCSHFFSFHFQMGMQNPVTYKVEPGAGVGDLSTSYQNSFDQSHALDDQQSQNLMEQAQVAKNQRLENAFTDIPGGITFTDNAAAQESTNNTLETLNGVVDFVTCPLCSHQNAKGLKDCTRCGLDFERYREKQDRIERSQKHQVFETGQDDDLEFQWRALNEQWSDESRHHTFLSLCDKKKALSFAAGKYNRYLIEKPQDAQAKKMKARIRSLAESELMVKNSNVRKQSRKKTPYLKYLTALGLLMAIGLMLTGLMVREFSSLVSLGLSMTIFIVGLQFMFPKSSEL